MKSTFPTAPSPVTTHYNSQLATLSSGTSPQKRPCCFSSCRNRKKLTLSDLVAAAICSYELLGDLRDLGVLNGGQEQSNISSLDAGLTCLFSWCFDCGCRRGRGDEGMGRVVCPGWRRSEGELSRLVREKLSADLSWNRRTLVSGRGGVTRTRESRRSLGVRIPFKHGMNGRRETNS